MKKLKLSIAILSLAIISSLSYSQSQVFYGMSRYGGSAPSGGAIFKFNPTTNHESVVHNLGIGTDGSNPYGNLVYCKPNGLFYGMTYYGGANGNAGAIISFNPSNNAENLVWSFSSGTGGSSPEGDLVYDTINNLFYGMTIAGGANYYGAIISFNPTNNTESVVFSFNNTDGADPIGNLVYDKNNSLFYGMTQSGGANYYGTIFTFNPNNNAENVVWSFNNSNGSGPNGSLVLDPNNGLFYGTTSAGGANFYGTIFSFNTSTNIATVEWSFNNANGSSPNGVLTFQPSSGLFYGMTADGGANYYGSIFSFNPGNNIATVVWSFGGGSDGKNPNGNLLLDDFNGLFYGVTSNGGTNYNGVIFSFNPATNKDSVLYNFGTLPDASYPNGDLTMYSVSPNSIPGISHDDDLITVYPNPNVGNFTITGLSKGQIVELYNALGQKVWSAVANNSTQAFDVSGNVNGVYMIRILNTNGTLLSLKKIIKA